MPVKPAPEPVPDHVVRAQQQLFHHSSIRRAATGVEAAQERLAEAVRTARAVEISWAQIGHATHLTAEGARRRWGQS